MLNAGSVADCAAAGRSAACGLRAPPQLDRRKRGAGEMVVYRTVLVAAAVVGLPALPHAGEARQPSTVEGEAAAVDGHTLRRWASRWHPRLARADAERARRSGRKGHGCARHLRRTRRVYRARHRPLRTPRGGLHDVLRWGDFAEVMIRAGHAAHCPAYGRPDLASLPDNGFELPACCR